MIKMKLKLNLFVLLLLILLPLAGCTSSNNENIEKLDVLMEQVSNLENEIAVLKKETEGLMEKIVEYGAYDDLTDLTSLELKKFDQFKVDYNDEVLADLDPISVFKLFLFAKFTEDYETQYELFTDNAEYVLVNKEAFLNDPQDRIPFGKEIFRDVYDLHLEVVAFDVEHATISWKSKNGVVDENAGAFVYGFALQKYGEVWKVSYLPMN